VRYLRCYCFNNGMKTDLDSSSSRLDQRLEEARMHEQAEEFARQEKILKLISSELTRNTTRVVEQAVKTEVQQSVLPSLESITRAEVKAVLSDQIGSGVVELVNRVTTHSPCFFFDIHLVSFRRVYQGRLKKFSSGRRFRIIMQIC